MAKKQAHTDYENNPFYVGLNGLKLFFTNAQSVAIYAVALTAIYAVLSMISSVIDALDSMKEPTATVAPEPVNLPVIDPAALMIGGAIVASIVFCFIVIGALLYGVFEYTAAQLALGKKAQLGDAFKEVARHIASYIWLYIIVFVKIFLWSLLLIVPGIIMAIRYSLAGTVFFAEGKRGNAAVKRSLELTKGAWFTVYASISQSSIWNLITFGLIMPLLQPGANAIMYRQLRDVTDAKLEKPAAHWLSWATFFTPIVLFMLFLSFIVLMVVLLGSAYGWR